MPDMGSDLQVGFLSIAGTFAVEPQVVNLYTLDPILDIESSER